MYRSSNNSNMGVVVYTTLLLCLCLCCCLQHVEAWGAEGHSIVADIGTTMLTTKARAAVMSYIPGQTMQSVSSVPDTYDHTDEGKWSEPLHFVDMLRNQTEYQAIINCKPLCVVGGIQNYTQRLIKNYTATLMDEPNALIFLIHFVGDIHQPLHVGWADDVGGNTIKCRFYGQSTELHAVWDTGIITHYNNQWQSFSQELQATIKANVTILDTYTKNMDPVDWANESFGFVKSDVYQGVTGTNPDLSDTYYNHNLPIIKQRLMAAGIRLGTLLNSIFK
jgi:hypothetical protein